MKGRPIVSGIGSLPENISAYVDNFIKSALVTLPSYVRDSVDFIDTLKKFEATPNILLATLDVQSLYTNIPHDGGVSALKHFLTLTWPESKPSTD